MPTGTGFPHVSATDSHGAVLLGSKQSFPGVTNFNILSLTLSDIHIRHFKRWRLSKVMIRQHDNWITSPACTNTK